MNLIDHKRSLRKIKRVSRRIEMTAESGPNGLSGEKKLQFCHDVELYGLYEALLYVSAYDVDKSQEIATAALEEIK